MTRKPDAFSPAGAACALPDEAIPRIDAEGLTVLEPRYTSDSKPLRYLAEPQLIAVAEAALRRRRPVLLVGEAGVGKTRFAHAVARYLYDRGYSSKAEPYACVVRSDTRARDLFYSYDSLNRFGDAHSADEAMRRRARETRNYLDLQPLGRAFASGEWCVALIDEIDKAVRDLPNDLLDALEDERFEIPEIASDEERAQDPGYFQDALKIPSRAWMTREIRLWTARPGSGPPGEDDILPGKRRGWPLLVVTSNSERVLPKPFLRRCFFHHIEFPEARLEEILRPRCPDLPKARFEALVELVLKLRSEELEKRPCLSEAMDFLSAMSDLHRVNPAAAVFRLLETWAARKDKDARFDWSKLDHLGCLVKLQNDRDRLLGRSAFATG